MKLWHVLPRLSFVALLLSATLTFAQNPQELQLAERLMRAGNFETALRVFERHYDAGIYTPKVVNGISSCLRELGQYDKWVEFLKEVTRRSPDVYSYRIELGEALYFNKQQDSAFAVWRDVYQTERPDIMRYRLVAQAMANLRLMDDAADVYLAALERIPNQLTLHFDLANLYRIQLEYEKAVDHYMVYFERFDKQRSYVRSLILNMARDDEATRRIIERLEEKEVEGNPDMMELLANLYMRKKSYARAFELYRTIEGYSEPGAFAYMKRFAVEAARDDEWPYAIRAYDYMLQNSEDRPAEILFRMAEATYNYGRAQSDSLPQQASQNVNRALALLVEIDARGNYGRAARELSGDIYLDYFEDLDKALELYRSLKPEKMRGAQADRLKIKTAEVMLLKNDLQAAEDLYKAVEDQRYQSLANFRMAELRLYRGQVEPAKEAFNAVLAAAGMQDSLANNALEQIFFIDNFAADSAAFRKFVEAELQQRQKQYGRAAKTFEEVAGGSGSLALEAAWRAAELYRRLDEQDKAIELLASSLERFTDADGIDKITFLLAGILEEKGDYERALTLYREIIINYPSGFYNEDARLRARQITEKIQNTVTP